MIYWRGADHPCQSARSALSAIWGGESGYSGGSGHVECILRDSSVMITTLFESGYMRERLLRKGMARLSQISVELSDMVMHGGLAGFHSATTGSDRQLNLLL